MDDVQCERYDASVTRKISAPKYIDVGFLQALGMWDDVNTSVGHLGWRDYVQLQFSMYEKLVCKLFSSFTTDTAGKYHNGRCYIRFRLGDLTREMNLARFSELLQLPPSSTSDFTHKDYGRSEFWEKITCHGQPYVSRSLQSHIHMQPRPYVPSVPHDEYYLPLI